MFLSQLVISPRQHGRWRAVQSGTKQREGGLGHRIGQIGIEAQIISSLYCPCVDLERSLQDTETIAKLIATRGC